VKKKKFINMLDKFLHWQEDLAKSEPNQDEVYAYIETSFDGMLDSCDHLYFDGGHGGLNLIKFLVTLTSGD